MAERKLRVLYAAAEVAPFSKVGGLADVAGALPRALIAEKVDIRLITPLYGMIDRSAWRIRRVAGLGDLHIPIGEHDYAIRFFRGNLPDSKVQVFFMECDDLFAGEGVYADPASGHDYPDNPARFILFSKAILSFLQTGVFDADILHLNDNQTALAAAMMKTSEAYADARKLPTLLTIHNIQYQGNYSLHHLYDAGLSPYLAAPGGPFEFYGGFNFLKAGIEYADKINTVSDTYARETLQFDEISFGLQGVLNNRKNDYFGILNGADYNDWNPAKDKHLVKTYSSRNLSGKTVNKQDLIELCDFNDPAAARPLAGIITRLVQQKGLDLLLEALPRLMEQTDINLVILGSGAPHYAEALRAAEAYFPGRLKVFLKFDNTLAHRIEAGSDLYLMPSVFEPCGLNQLYSLKYGALPVVHYTGGLADTVQEVDPATGKGWGFTFTEYSVNGFMDAILRAVEAYGDRDTWAKLVKRAMLLDFSWAASAKRYKEVYKSLVDGQS